MENNGINDYFEKKLSLSTQVVPSENDSFLDSNKNFIELHSVSIHNRKTHSELVAKIAKNLVKKWDKFQALEESEKEKFKSSLYKTCMLHDIGQTSYGHALADITNEVIGSFDKNLFFDDNSNNLTFLEMYNLKKILKTLGISYEDNIEKINDILMLNSSEENYYKNIYKLYHQIEEDVVITKDDIFLFKKQLEDENMDLLLDKDLLCYLIKRPIVLNRELGITKGLYPYLHERYNKHFFDLKLEERNNGMEINKTQLNVTWFMDMSDEIAYICGDLINFLNMYHNIDNFKEYIDSTYNEDTLRNIENLIIEKCNFSFLKKIDKNTDFKMIENKLVKHFLENISIKSDTVYDSKIEKLFSNPETFLLFEEIRKINYGVFIDFMKKNVEKEFGQRQSMASRSRMFLTDVLSDIFTKKTMDQKLVENIYSDLYKELIKHNLKEGNEKEVAKLYVNYLMELNIKQYDKSLKLYYEEVKKDIKKDKKLKNKVEKLKYKCHNIEPIV